MKIFVRIAKYTLIILVIAVAAATWVGYRLPSEWKVVRSITINTPPRAIYPFVANFKTGWPRWSAFDTEDPLIVYEYSGPDEGHGAKRSWISKKMGNGSQRITKAAENGVAFTLKTEKPEFEIEGEIWFNSTPPNTIVTWTDYGNFGENPFYKIMGALMDRMTGKTFEASLAKLKELSEKSYQDEKNKQN